MAHYAIKIVKRRRAGETRGMVTDMIEFDAENDDAAQHHALTLIDDLNWITHFAALEGFPGEFQTFWMNKPHT